MKNLKLLLIFAVVTIFCFGCEKKDNVADNLEDGQITMEIGGKTFKSASIDNFENLTDVNNWNAYPGGSLSIDTLTSAPDKEIKYHQVCFNFRKHTA